MEPAAYYKNPRSSEPDSPVSAQRSAPTPVSARALLTRMLCRNLLTAAIGKRPCENVSACRERRTSQVDWASVESNHTAHAPIKLVLENCIFHISPMYDFPHS